MWCITVQERPHTGTIAAVFTPVFSAISLTRVHPFLPPAVSLRTSSTRPLLEVEGVCNPRLERREVMGKRPDFSRGRSQVTVFQDAEAIGHDFLNLLIVQLARVFTYFCLSVSVPTLWGTDTRRRFESRSLIDSRPLSPFLIVRSICSANRGCDRTRASSAFTLVSLGLIPRFPWRAG